MGPAGNIAHYGVTAKIGEGGMGEVWRSTDTKLREVTLQKCYPPAFAVFTNRACRRYFRGTDCRLGYTSEPSEPTDARFDS